LTVDTGRKVRDAPLLVVALVAYELSLDVDEGRWGMAQDKVDWQNKGSLSVRRYICVALSVLACGCPSTTDLALTIRNPNQVSGEFVIESQEESGKVFEHNEHPVVAADTKPFQQTYTVPRGGRVKLFYTPESATTKILVDTLDIPANGRPVTVDRALEKVERYDQKLSEELLKGLATSIEADSLAYESLLDTQHTLGCLILGSEKDGKVTPVGYIPLTDISIGQRQSLKVRNKIVTTQNVVAGMSASVPLFGSLSATMKTNEFYQVLWDVEHFQFNNTNLDVEGQLSAMTETRLAAVQANLSNHPGLNLYVIHSMHVLSQGVFAVTQGRQMRGTLDSSISTVFTASGSYQFDFSSDQYYAVNDIVMNIHYAKYAERAQFDAYVDQLILQKHGGPAPPKPPSPPQLISGAGSPKLDLVDPCVLDDTVRAFEAAGPCLNACDGDAKLATSKCTEERCRRGAIAAKSNCTRGCVQVKETHNRCNSRATF
jgi:hypothetical protein